MPTTHEDALALGLCLAAVVGGLGLIALGHYLMPLRALRHAWRNRY